MAVLFRLERNPKFKGSDPPAGSDFGWRWIEVVAIEPRAIAGPEPQDAEGWREFRNWYVCRTEGGLKRIAAEELWSAIEENREYVLAPESGKN